MRLLLLSLIGISVSLQSHAQSFPGNVSTNLRWWLKADAGVFTDNGTTGAANSQLVQQWNDQSAIANHARQTTDANKPTFLTNRINGNPTLQFGGNHFITALAVSGVTSNQSFHMFLVLKQNSYLTTGNVNDGNGTFIVDRTPETNNLMSFKISATNKFNYQKRNDGGGNLEGPESVTVAPTGTFNTLDFYRVFGTNYGIFIDGRSDVSTTANASDAITGPTIQLGRHAVNANQGMNGEMAEVIIYNGTLTTAERRRIESYLAIKYGNMLDQTTLTDYVNSAGTVVYPVSSNANFNAYRYDIAGIARDNNTALLQTTSQSQNTNYVVTASGATSLDNNDYLVWGSNNGSLTSPNSADVDGTTIRRRLSRAWRVAETGTNTGTITLSFDLSAVPGAKSQTSLRLLIDRDNDGFADNDVAPISGTLTGSVFTVTVDLQNGDVFTIGTTNIGTTPLPVELLSFDVATENSRVIAFWKTGSETNNNFFTLERSVTGAQWESLMNIAGQGTTAATHQYQAVDSLPLYGRSYYRLKQTDFDGQFSYSPVRTVLLEGEEQGVAVYPNPNDGEAIWFYSRNGLYDGEPVEISNALQQKVQHAMLIKSHEKSYAYSVKLKEKLAPGVYLVTLNISGRRSVFKILVEKK